MKRFRFGAFASLRSVTADAQRRQAQMDYNLASREPTIPNNPHKLNYQMCLPNCRPVVCRSLGLLAWLATTVFPTVSTQGETSDWSRFHGNNSQGAVSKGSLPRSWSVNDYVWSAKLKGSDVGSPAIADGRVFLLDSSVSDEPDTVDFVALDLKTGKELWRKSQPLANRRRHKRNSPASTTPAVHDGKVVFAYGDAAGVHMHGYTVDGDLIWSRELGRWTGYHGFGTSPVIVGAETIGKGVDSDRVILFNSQQADRLEANQVAGESLMMAFDLRTGEDVWQTKLKTTRPSYGVPAIYELGGNEAEDKSGPAQLIAANTGDGMFGLDLATGKMLWSLPVFSKRCCSSPIIVDGVAIASCGSGGGGNVLSGVRIPVRPGEQPKEVLRMDRSAPYVPTPTVRERLMFSVSDSGIATCLDLNDGGAKRWSQRLGGDFGASPVIVGDSVLMISLDGTAFVMDASGEASKVSQFDLGGRVGATPGLAGGYLLLRVADRLHALSMRDSTGF